MRKEVREFIEKMNSLREEIVPEGFIFVVSSGNGNLIEVPMPGEPDDLEVAAAKAAISLMRQKGWDVEPPAPQGDWWFATWERGLISLSPWRIEWRYRRWAGDEPAFGPAWGEWVREALPLKFDREKLVKLVEELWD